jgi:hypothetical protein
MPSFAIPSHVVPREVLMHCYAELMGRTNNRWSMKRSRVRDGGESDAATVQREAELVLISELGDSATPAELLHDVTEDVEANAAEHAGRRFRLTRARVASAGGVVVLALAAIVQRSRRAR